MEFTLISTASLSFGQTRYKPCWCSWTDSDTIETLTQAYQFGFKLTLNDGKFFEEVFNTPVERSVFIGTGAKNLKKMADNVIKRCKESMIEFDGHHRMTHETDAPWFRFWADNNDLYVLLSEPAVPMLFNISQDEETFKVAITDQLMHSIVYATRVASYMMGEDAENPTDLQIAAKMYVAYKHSKE